MDEMNNWCRILKQIFFICHVKVVRHCYDLIWKKWELQKAELTTYYTPGVKSCSRINLKFLYKKYSIIT